ncbi:PAC2 family protein [uncultured archaeon]|nr:PAC2 family protein [uncultured archaeon]
MEGTKIFYKKMRFRAPILIVGLPGMGNVGDLVAKHLRTELKAKKFATLYSAHFPFQVLMFKDGKFRMVSNRFYYYADPKGKHDIILLLGDTQPGDSVGQYAVNERIVEFFKMLGGKTVYTIGGYSLGNQYVKEPRVFGVGTDERMRDYLKKQGVVLPLADLTPIFGSAGMVVAFSKRHGLAGACIMGETGMVEVDANSAKAVLQVLSRMLGIKVNLGSIEKIKANTEKLLKDMEESAKSAQQQDMKPQSYIR